MTVRQAVVPVSQQHIFNDWHIAPAMKAGGVLYCSGVLGVREDGSIPPDNQDQYQQVFHNLKALLDEAGVGYSDIVDILSFHLHLAEQISVFSEVKDQYIARPYPPWTAVEVSGLGAGAFPGALVEMKVTAVLPHAHGD